MAYTTPTFRSTADLITATIWNTDLVANLIFYKTSIDDNGKAVLSGLQSKSANYTLVTSDDGVIVTSGTNTQTLPTAVGCKGKEYLVKNAGTGVVTVATTSSQTIDGVTTYVLTSQYQSVTVVSDGANWQVI